MSSGKDNFQSRAVLVLGEPRTPSVVVWMKKRGITKSYRGAGRTLILIMLSCIAITVVVVNQYILPFI